MIEQDRGTVDEQAAILAHLAKHAPLALAVHSGSRSLHAWFFCAGQSENTLRGFMRCAVTLGADRATWTRSQFVRMPDGTRESGNRPDRLFLQPWGREMKLADGSEMILARRWQDIPEVETEPKSPRMELPETLEDVKGFLCRYVVFSSEAQANAIALWIVHTWVTKAFDYTPYLYISSPVKRCGKSRVFDCLKLLCANPWLVVSVTEAVLFRKIEKNAPTLLLDEVDAIFTPKNGEDGKEALRALLNAGFQRGATVPRCVGPNYTLTEFRVFGAKALAGIGKLPDTVADRSIPIRMVRRKRNQHVEKFRTRDAETVAKPIAIALQAWGERQTVIDKLREARPNLPEGLNDRAADICEPLLAIADLAGGKWR